MSRVLFYAMGGGHGHLARTGHLLAELSQRRCSVETLVLCPERARPWAQHLGPIHSTGDVGRAALGRWVHEQIASFQPDLMVVDTFPRGVLGELRRPDELPSALVTRWVDPGYYRHPAVRQALERYHAICWTEPRSDPCFPGLDCQPVLDLVEPLPREQARAVWKVADGQALVVGLGSGPEQGQRALLQSLLEIRKPSLVVRWCSREMGCATPDVGRLLKGSDLVVSACGYNSYYETARAGVPALWIPQSRQVDDQRRRAEGAFPFAHKGPQSILERRSELSRQLFCLLEAGPLKLDWEPPRGRQQVVDVLVRLLTKGIAPQ